MTRSELISLIKRNLGSPLIKIELVDDQIIDSINYARDRFIKRAIGNVVQEDYITMMLSGGQSVYDLPSTIREVVDYADGSGGGGMGGKINTLFTIENYFFSQGMLSNLSQPFDLVGYHVALDFLETLSRYTVSKYNWRYNRFKNQITLSPSPPTGSYMVTYDATGGEVLLDVSGYALLKVYKVETEIDDLYEEQTIQDYATALSMRKLGFIRRKYANTPAMGNQGMAMDGESLISEANTWIEQLEERIDAQEVFEGYNILIG